MNHLLHALRLFWWWFAQPSTHDHDDPVAFEARREAWLAKRPVMK